MRIIAFVGSPVGDQEKEVSRVYVYHFINVVFSNQIVDIFLKGRDMLLLHVKFFYLNLIDQGNLNRSLFN